MFIYDQYKLYQMIHTFINEYDYRLLQIDIESDVVWLEKSHRQITYILRLQLTGFDWKNYLKQHMLQTMHQLEQYRRIIRGRNVEFYNIYISSHAPVDDWSVLKQPVQHPRYKHIRCHMFYFDRENFYEEYNRFYEQTNMELDWVYDIPSETYAEQFISAYKNRLVLLKKQEKEKMRQIFSYGKVQLTYILMIVNVLIFMFVEFTGSSMDIEHLIDLGAKYNPYIVDGEWWRIISSMFLHIGFLHLFMNMLALYYLGHAVERIFGTFRFLIIYMLAGISGGLASFAFTIHVSAGASGAIFGLFGALLFFGMIHRQLFFQTMGRNLLFIVGINIVFGFVVPQIDNSAHLGGLVGGFIAAAIVHLPKNKQIIKQLMATVIYVLMTIFLIGYGLNEHTNSGLYEMHQIEELLSMRKYDEAIERITVLIEQDDELLPHYLFQRGYAYIKVDEIDLAIADLEACIALTDDIPEAYYNLALLYYDIGKYESAEEMIREAVNLDPSNEMFQNIYDEIIGN